MFYSVLFLVSLIVATQGTAIGFNGTASCAGGCAWSDATIFDASGAHPGPGDTVDLFGSASATINVDIDVNVDNFYIGNADTPTAVFTLNILSGRTMTIGSLTGNNGDVTFRPSAVVILQNNATLVVGGSLTNNGLFTVAGSIFVGSANSGLTSETLANTNPLHIIDSVLALQGCRITAPSVNINQVLLKATLSGYGNITGNVNCQGELHPGADDATTGTIWIAGSLSLNSVSKSYFDLKSKSDFDRVILTGSIHVTDANLYLSPINNYQPVMGQRFYIMNHTEFVGGFTTVSGTGFASVINNKWSVLPAQENTIVAYGSATSVALSIGVIIACLISVLVL